MLQILNEVNLVVPQAEDLQVLEVAHELNSLQFAARKVQVCDIFEGVGPHNFFLEFLQIVLLAISNEVLESFL